MAIRPNDMPETATVEQRRGLPPRVHGILTGLLEIVRDHFGNCLPRVLDETDGALFKLAERSSSNALQQEHFASRRLLEECRSKLLPRLVLAIDHALARVRAPAGAAPAPSVQSPGELELVNASVFEEDLALREIVGKCEIRNSQPLYLLSHRLGVVAGTPAWSNDELPLGPAQIVAAFRSAVAATPLGLEARLLTYRQFDRVAMLPIGALFDRLNAYLVQQRVLPHLQWQVARPTRGEALRETIAREAAASAPADATAGASPAAAGDDLELFRALRGLLVARRRDVGYDAGLGGASARVADATELQAVLGMLQREPSAAHDATDTAHAGARFRADLSAALRRGGPGGDPLRMADEDADTVDLIGMLFDHLGGHVRAGSAARALIHRLRVPVLRVALGDKTFFSRRDHPARELLNTIAETGERWFDDGDSDPELTRKMQLVIESIDSEFDGDLSLFETMLGDLSQYMQLAARRAEAAERRHIDAAKGRDRLEIARDTARAAIVRVIQGGAPSARVRFLLEQAWADALALSALRQGADSAEFKRRLGVAIKLARDDAATSPAVREDESLRQELDAGLRQVGLHQDDADAVISGLFAAPPQAAAEETDEPAPADPFDQLLREKVRFGGDSGPAVGPPQRERTPLNAEEKAMLERMRSIPFGTWFDFIKNQQGDVTRRKLAWFSTVTGRCLFVNQRGVRVEERTLEQLARDMARGQVRMVVPERTSLIDRTWRAILEALRLGDGHAPAHAAEA